MVHLGFFLINSDFSELCQRIRIIECESLSTVMAYFAVVVETLNPDILAGHNLTNEQFPLILEHMDNFHQMKLSKIKSKDIEYSIKKPIRVRINSIFKGRLICDTFTLASEHLKEENHA